MTMINTNVGALLARTYATRAAERNANFNGEVGLRKENKQRSR
jgi:hypothetical protein